jgi:hypothetical protein
MTPGRRSNPGGMLAVCNMQNGTSYQMLQQEICLPVKSPMYGCRVVKTFRAHHGKVMLGPRCMASHNRCVKQLHANAQWLAVRNKQDSRHQHRVTRPHTLMVTPRGLTAVPDNVCRYSLLHCGMNAKAFLGHTARKFETTARRPPCSCKVWWVT